MNRFADLFAPIVGRILMGGYFLWSAVGVALDSPHLSIPGGFFMLIEAVAGIMLIVGYKTRHVALALTLFVIVAAFVDAHFVLSDIAIIGGLLYIGAYGSGFRPRT